MIARLKVVIKAILVGLDCFAASLLFGVAYLITNTDPVNGRQTISGHIGRAATQGLRWGLIAETPIDWLFGHLGSAPLHCRRTYAFEVRHGIQS
ncbi:hypothetical protein D3Y57_09835 [Sphingomonas paeninsulae]|uniref:Uncharacterized protein n=1 Tax=Sphingomonas paeninsulae TaxID=2319844 RepID=A0A494TAX4_SPHPE|nr:hypothetical protein [Sphingomonas paeninsulae]AYJ86210.1 hypothetical protein D3Y57_09835 [Sphingomonas paeninsulae]